MGAKFSLCCKNTFIDDVTYGLVVVLTFQNCDYTVCLSCLSTEHPLLTCSVCGDVSKVNHMNIFVQSLFSNKKYVTRIVYSFPCRQKAAIASKDEDGVFCENCVKHLGK